MVHHQLASINLHQLDIFFSLAETLSFTQTAHDLNMTQSNVSKNLIKLESILELTLFERSSKGVCLTSMGAACYQAWSELIEKIEQGYANALICRDSTQEELCIGMPIDLDYSLIYMRLREVCQNLNPPLKLTFLDGSMEYLKESIKNGSIAMAIIPDRARFELDSKLIAWRYLTLESQYVVVSKRHAFAQLDSVSMTDILDAPHIIASQSKERNSVGQHQAIYRDYGKIPTIAGYYSSKYEIPDLLEATSGLFVAGAHFPEKLFAGCKKLPINDQYSGTIAIWNKQQANARISKLIQAVGRE